MTQTSRLNMRWPVALVLAVLLVGAGAAAAYFGWRVEDPATAAGDPAGSAAAREAPMAPPDREATDTPLPDVPITLTADAIERARITIATVESRDGTAVMRLPAVVEPNAYRQVGVTPLAAGRVTRVAVELGAPVKQGQMLAQVFSPELAEAQTQYLAERAALEAQEKEVKRTEKLAEIGAASRQELERVRAEHAEREARVESVAARLALFGRSRAALARLSAHDQFDAVMNVPSPIAGVITERIANVGLNVDSSMKLFTVVDLSTVWVVADLYEKDFSRVRAGNAVIVTTAAYPDRRLDGRVAYIDPQVSPDTRTAKIRVEVRNPRHELRLGMLAEVQVAQAIGPEQTPWLPGSAVQRHGDRTFVYLVTPDARGQFIEREVRLGRSDDERVEVLTGVAPGDSVVADGSFYVRAEAERLGLRAGRSGDAPKAMPAGAAEQSKPAIHSAKITVSERGFEPAKIAFRAGMPARLTFVRVTEKTCATEVEFPALKIRRELPLNEPVDIELTPQNAGEIAFACGMNMFRGTIVVQ